MKKARSQKTLKLQKLSIANLNSILGGNGDPSGISDDNSDCNPDTNDDPDTTQSGNSTLVPRTRSNLNTCNANCTIGG